MSDLLRRYPDVDEAERRQLLGFLTGGAPEEIVEVTRVQGLGPQLAAFRSDHRREFRTGLSGWLPMTLFFGIPMLAVIWRLLG